MQMYCTNCGQKLNENDKFCTNCGAKILNYTNVNSNYNQNSNVQTDKGLSTIIKVFLIIGCVASGSLLIPLIWTIPMTVTYFNASKNGTPVSLGFKICTLIFVSQIAGILMLLEKDQKIFLKL